MKTSQSLIACGLNYKTAPLKLREKLALPKEQLPQQLAYWSTQPGIRETVILSTCNRTEWYFHSENGALVREPAEWLAEIHQLPAANLVPHLYVLQGAHTVKHAFRVASGIDSMVLGEPQILGQLKSAVAVADQHGTLGKHLRALFSQAFWIGKQVRTQTAVGKHPVSLGYVVLQLAKRIFADLAHCRVLLIGAGETVQLVARHLYSEGLHQLCIANRTLASGQRLVENLGEGAYAVGLGDMPQQILQADIIVTAVHSDIAVIGKGMIESALKSRKRRPLLVVDLAMPRNVEPEVQTLEDVYLYALDDLQHILEENHRKREDAAGFAEEMIDAHAVHFLASLEALKASHLIQRYRQQANGWRDELLQEAFQALAVGQDAKDVLEKFSFRLVNKLLHHPSVSLRNAAYRGELDRLAAAEKLFGLDNKKNQEQPGVTRKNQEQSGI